MNMLYTMSVNQFLSKRYSFSQVLPCLKVIFKNITKENQNITLTYIKKRSKIKKKSINIYLICLFQRYIFTRFNCYKCTCSCFCDVIKSSFSRIFHKTNHFLSSKLKKKYVRSRRPQQMEVLIKL